MKIPGVTGEEEMRCLKRVSAGDTHLRGNIPPRDVMILLAEGRSAATPTLDTLSGGGQAREFVVGKSTSRRPDPEDRNRLTEFGRPKPLDGNRQTETT